MYKTVELKQNAIKSIKENEFIFLDELISSLGISRQTFYNHNLDKIDCIKDALMLNKIKIKSKLRAKWFDSNNATLQIALYKLIATNEELQRLNNNLQVSEERDNTVTLKIIGK